MWDKSKAHHVKLSLSILSNAKVHSLSVQATEIRWILEKKDETNILYVSREENEEDFRCYYYRGIGSVCDV